MNFDPGVQGLVSRAGAWHLGCRGVQFGLQGLGCRDWSFGSDLGLKACFCFVLPAYTRLLVVLFHVHV